VKAGLCSTLTIYFKPTPIVRQLIQLTELQLSIELSQLENLYLPLAIAYLYLSPGSTITNHNGLIFRYNQTTNLIEKAPVNSTCDWTSITAWLATCMTNKTMHSGNLGGTKRITRYRAWVGTKKQGLNDPQKKLTYTRGTKISSLLQTLVALYGQSGKIPYYLVIPYLDLFRTSTLTSRVKSNILPKHKADRFLYTPLRTVDSVLSFDKQKLTLKYLPFTTDKDGSILLQSKYYTKLTTHCLYLWYHNSYIYHSQIKSVPNIYTIL